VLTAQSHLLVRQELDSLSRALNVNVLFLSNCDKYLNHKHFIPQFFLCWKRDRPNSRKRARTNYFGNMRAAISDKCLENKIPGELKWQLYLFKFCGDPLIFQSLRLLKIKLKLEGFLKSSQETDVFLDTVGRLRKLFALQMVSVSFPILAYSSHSRGINVLYRLHPHNRASLC